MKRLIESLQCHQCVGQVCLTMLLFWGMGPMVARAQQIGFVEKFALANDRTVPLRDLIPGSEDYFYYHCLHLQNEGKIPEAEAVLQQWSTAIPLTEKFQRMQTRQRLLAYDLDPDATLQYLRSELGLMLEHAAPQTDRVKDLASTLDPSLLDSKRLIDQAIAADPSLNGLLDRGLMQILQRKMSIEQLRLLLQRTRRVDVKGIVGLIVKELQSKESRGWGAFPIHSELTLQQYREVATKLPSLLESDVFVRQYLYRLLPSDDVGPADIPAQREHLQRLEDFVETLPASQNSLKAGVLYRRLVLEASQENYDAVRFEKYLALPRQQAYYNQTVLANLQNKQLVEMGANYQAEARIAPIQNDVALIREYLEHFFRTEEKVDRFARWLDREYLESVMVETKILYGVGDSGSYYARLSADQQKELRDRVEVRFASSSALFYQPNDLVQLQVDLKNVRKLIVRVYHLNPRNIYRKSQKAVSTDLDLDGLVANSEKAFEYSLAADRRHREVLTLEDCSGRGTWIVDILGEGIRSRAMIVKGQLRSTQRLTDVGTEMRIYDESGLPVPTATVELGTRSFSPGEEGSIVIPYSEQASTVPMLLVDQQVATVEVVSQRRESYQLEAGVLVDSQNLIAGTKGSLVIRPRLVGNGISMPLEILEEPRLVITTRDQEGISSSQVIAPFSVVDERESTHQFLVPPRLSQITVELSGKVLVASRNVHEPVSVSWTSQVNQIAQTDQVAVPYLIHDDQGYRLQLRGRNGERLERMPLYVSLQTEVVATPVVLTLATDAQGEVRLGNIANVTSMVVSGDHFEAKTFTVSHDDMVWPGQLNVATNEVIRLPWVHSGAEGSFTLVETRQGKVFADHTSKVKQASGQLQVESLPPGSYRLTDHQSGRGVEIRSIAGANQHGFLLGANRTAQQSIYSSATIEKSEIRGGKVRIQITGGSAATRLCLVASAFVPERSLFERLHVGRDAVWSASFGTSANAYHSGLRLDEEYQYILQRQYATKYAGNMLAQPSLLLNPWVSASTDTGKQDASEGDAMPLSSAAPGRAAAEYAPGFDKRMQEEARTGTYDFLARGSMLLANRTVGKDEWFEISLEDLSGMNSLTVCVLDAEGLVCSRLPLPASEIKSVDLRLAKAFEADRHWTQRRQVKVIAPNQKTDLGDANSTRVQFYGKLSDVYRLYSTLLGNGQLEPFRKLANWPSLTDQEKRLIYSELACHELHLFLYRKDRAFFDQVVRPYLENKYELQFVDRWLMERSLDEDGSLWQRRKMNTMEKVLALHRLPGLQVGMRKWLGDEMQTQPIPLEETSRRFQIALLGSALDVEGYLSLGSPVIGRSGEGFEPSFGAPPSDGPGGVADAMMEKMESEQAEAGKSYNAPKPADPSAGGFGGARKSLRGRSGKGAFKAKGLYATLDKTRQWEDSQYFRIPLSQQQAMLIPPSPFWKELSEQAGLENLLPLEMHHASRSLTEALVAMALIDLPFEANPPQLEVENGRLMATVGSQSLVYVESIEEAAATQKPVTILVGHDIYLLRPNRDSVSNPSIENRPVTGEALVRGVGYRSSVVVTNPSSTPQVVSVLTQIPQGAMALQAGRSVKSTDLRLEPYSTKQIEYAYYFPQAGKFEHYGAQVSVEGAHVAEAKSAILEILDAPAKGAQDTWNYVAQWGDSEQVLAYLRQRNLQQLDLSLIAFRMQDRKFYGESLTELESQGVFDATLWAYSLLHRDAPRIAQLLSHRDDFIQRIGPYLRSPLIQYDTRERGTYQHLDFRPLVSARAHQLGAQRLILNDGLNQQYHRMLERLAHRNALEDGERMAVTYYLLLQGRIEEALSFFQPIQATQLPTKIQYDYMDAYLDFYRGNYDRARQIAESYQDYPVLRWREWFAQIRHQVAQRQAMLEGRPASTVDLASEVTDPIQRLLLEARQSRHLAEASTEPAFELQAVDGRLVLEYQHLQEAEVRFYLMDIEILFSRNPFVQQKGSALLAIQPNQIQKMEMPNPSGKLEVVVPKEIANRNVLVEVSSNGLIRSQVVYANQMEVALVGAYGQLQVTYDQQKPVDRAYIKVYARHQGGEIKFYKDGYTDLRGQFDYASLSTGDLTTVERFSILIMHPERGALIREVEPPQR